MHLSPAPETPTRETDRLAREKRHWLASRHDLTLARPWLSDAGRIRKARRVAHLTAPGLERTAAVLELGCGSGVFTEDLCRHFSQLTSVDLSRELLGVARARLPMARFAEMDAHRLDFAAGVFDAVIGVSILHHLRWDDALREAFRVLKPGGWVRFSEPNLLNPQIFLQKNIPFLKRWAGDTPDEYAFTATQIRVSLRSLGFVEIEVQPIEFLHPSTPKKWIAVVLALESLLMRTPLRAFAGSLLISARRP